MLGRVRVFDVAGDPGETRDLAGERTERAKACEADLRDWAARTRGAVLEGR